MLTWQERNRMIGIEHMVLRQKPVEFQSVKHVIKWMALHAQAVAFGHLPFDRQLGQIVIMVGAMRGLAPCRYDGGTTGRDGDIRGLTLWHDGKGYVLSAVRAEGASVFTLADLAA